jgi:hypothetical protein
MSLLITMLSFFFLDSTNIAAYPSWKQGAVPVNWFPRAWGLAMGAETNAPVKIPFPCWNQV